MDDCPRLAINGYIIDELDTFKKKMLLHCKKKKYYLLVRYSFRIIKDLI